MDWESISNEVEELIKKIDFNWLVQSKRHPVLVVLKKR